MRRPATCTSTASPALWPQLSLTSLKRSRSRNITTGKRGPAPAGSGDALSQTVDEQKAIRQPRQGIVQDLVRQLGLGELFLEAVAPTILITKRLTTTPRAATLWARFTARNDGAQWTADRELAAGDGNDGPERDHPPCLGATPGDALHRDDRVGPDRDRAPAAQVDDQGHRGGRGEHPQVQAQGATRPEHRQRLARMLASIGTTRTAV